MGQERRLCDRRPILQLNRRRYHTQALHSYSIGLQKQSRHNASRTFNRNTCIADKYRTDSAKQNSSLDLSATRRKNTKECTACLRKMTRITKVSRCVMTYMLHKNTACLLLFAYVMRRQPDLGKQVSYVWNHIGLKHKCRQLQNQLGRNTTTLKDTRSSS